MTRKTTTKPALPLLLGILLTLAGCDHVPKGYDLRNPFPKPGPDTQTAPLTLSFVDAPVALLLDGFAIADTIPASDGDYIHQLPLGNHQVELIYMLRKGSESASGRIDPTKQLSSDSKHEKRSIFFNFDVKSGQTYHIRFEQGHLNSYAGTTIHYAGWSPAESASFPKFIKLRSAVRF